MYVVFGASVYSINLEEESLDGFYPDWLILKTRDDESRITVNVYGYLNLSDISAM